MVNATPFRAIFLTLAVRDTETTKLQKETIECITAKHDNIKGPASFTYARLSKFSPTVCELSKC